MDYNELYDNLTDNVINEINKIQYPFAFFENMDAAGRAEFVSFSEFLDMGCELNIISNGNEKVVSCTPYVDTHIFSSELGMLKFQQLFTGFPTLSRNQIP